MEIDSEHSFHNTTSIVTYEEREFYETLASISILSMVVLLLFAFCWGCFQDRYMVGVVDNHGDMLFDFVGNFKNCLCGTCRDLYVCCFRGVISAKSIIKSPLDSDPNQRAASNPALAVRLMQLALDTYYEEYGNYEVPDGWIVPSKTPWRGDLWGLELGKMVWALGLSASSSSTTTTSLNKSMSVVPTTSSKSTPSYGKSHFQDHERAEGEEEGDGHRSETWYEMFYDLVFVASALQLGLIIKYDHRPLGLVKASILFYMLRATWDHLTMYQNRYHSSDLTHMAFYILQAMGAFVISLHLRIEENVHYEGVKSAADRPYVFRVLLHTSLSTTVYFSSLLCPVDDDQRMYLWVWLAGILVERPLMLVFAFVQKDAPAMILKEHVGHLVHRHGTFFMLILGEAVIQLVQAYGGFDVFSYIRAILGFAVVFNVGNVYYEQQQREPHKHVLQRSEAMGYLWLELQSLLSLCVLFFAVGLKLVFHGFNEDTSFRDESLMCFFAAASLGLMYLMATLHRGLSYNTDIPSGRLYGTLFRLTVTLLCVAVPFLSPSSTVTVVELYVLTTALVLQDVYLRAYKMYLLQNWFGFTGKEYGKGWDQVMDSSLSSLRDDSRSARLSLHNNGLASNPNNYHQKPETGALNSSGVRIMSENERRDVARNGSNSLVPDEPPTLIVRSSDKKDSADVGTSNSRIFKIIEPP